MRPRAHIRIFLVTTTMTSSWTQALSRKVTNMACDLLTLYDDDESVDV